MIKWGVLGAAGIARKEFLPAAALASNAQAWAIGGRDLGRTRAMASEFGIVRAHPSYEALLNDPQIDAVYNPLPNHLHIPMTVAALKAGKHVICEKPMALNAAAIAEVVEAAEAAGKIAVEGFMVHYHPQWDQVRAWLEAGEIGPLTHIEARFTYYNDDPGNIRNQAEMGGGGLYDIGVYPVVTARMATGREPIRAACAVERDPASGVDTAAAGLLDFGAFRMSFQVGMRQLHSQGMRFHGPKGIIEVPTPYNPPNVGPYEITLTTEAGTQAVRYEDVNQFQLQIEAVSRAVETGDAGGLFSLADSARNQRALDALLAAARSGAWEEIS